MSRPNEIAPSILSADFSRLGQEVAAVEAYSGRIHIDVRDGHFVPNLSVGPAVVESLRPVTRLPLEVHLMVQDPERFVQAFVKAGADRLVVHAEVQAAEAIHAIREAGCRAGVAVSPGTSWERCRELLPLVDLVIVMTVNPGFGGQAFLREMLAKVSGLSREITERQMQVDIEVDGGISRDTVPEADAAGANVFVAGNAIFKAPSPADAARELADLVGAVRGVR